MPLLSRLLPPLLVVLHAGLLLWAVVGWFEWIFPTVPWPPLSNPLFPRWVLFLHWSAVLIASVLFLWGYFTRWPRTPAAMIPAYGYMAVVCFIETIWFLEGPLRFAAMAAEYVAYIAILVALHRVPVLTRRFRRTSDSGGPPPRNGLEPISKFIRRAKPERKRAMRGGRSSDIG